MGVSRAQFRPPAYTGGWCKSCIGSTPRCVDSSSSCQSSSSPAAATPARADAPARPREQPGRRGDRDSRTSAAISLTLPNDDRSIKFAIIGDSGRGSKEQHEVAAQMVAFRQRFDYKFVLMAGDNIYEGPATRRRLPAEVRRALQAAARRRRQVLRRARQSRRHQPDLLQAVQHGRPSLLHVRAAGRSDHALGYARAVLRARQHLSDRASRCAGSSRKSTESRAEWKIAFLHHPLYTSGRYGLAARGIRLALESAFVNGGVDVVFSGHEHIYERAELQHGILYFITGGAGSLRAGDASPSPAIARSYDQDYHFMLAEITDEGFFFQAINRTGVTVDAGIAAAAYCGHDGPSVICFDLGLEDAHPFRDRRRVHGRACRLADRSARRGTDPQSADRRAATAGRRGACGPPR